jgi:hypothetical protein
MFDDRNERRFRIKDIVNLTPERVAAFRAEGRDPGTPEQRQACGRRLPAMGTTPRSC